MQWTNLGEGMAEGLEQVCILHSNVFMQVLLDRKEGGSGSGAKSVITEQQMTTFTSCLT